MGARINYIFKSSNTEPSLVLYSHWGKTNWEKDLARALRVAAVREGDNSYYVRIAVSQLIGNEWGQELGFGLSAIENEKSFDLWNLSVVIDLINKTIIEPGRDPHSIDAFINYHCPLVETAVSI